MTTTSNDVYDAIPKVELHCHVEGTVRPETVLDLVARVGRSLPTDDPRSLYRYDSLDSFLSIFWLVQELVATRDDCARIAYESLVDAASHGLRYREMFFTPARHLAAGQRLDAIVAGLTDGIEQAERDSGVRCVLIADIAVPRGHSDPHAFLIMENGAWVTIHRGQRVPVIASTPQETCAYLRRIVALDNGSGPVAQLEQTQCAATAAAAN